MNRPSIVLKFGGTSLGTRGRVLGAVRRIRRHIERDEFPVIVASANGGATDRILGRLRSLARPSGSQPSREYDRAMTTGEDLSAALLAFALEEAGIPARSLRAREAGILGDGAHGAGRVRSIDCATIQRLASERVVPVVTGFQASRSDGEIITLGRGGSDTTAVAVAAALGPIPCHIITDVRGVFDRDPAAHPDATQIREMTHAALAALTRGGASVVHPDAAATARTAGVPLFVYHHRDSVGNGTRVGPTAIASAVEAEMEAEAEAEAEVSA